MTGITGTLHEDLYMFMKISWRILLKMRNVSGKSCGENHKTHFYVQCSENYAVHETMWKYLVEKDWPQM